MPPYGHLIARIMLHHLKESGVKREHLDQHSVFYRCSKAGLYKQMNETIPPGVQKRPDYETSLRHVSRWSFAARIERFTLLTLAPMLLSRKHRTTRTNEELRSTEMIWRPSARLGREIIRSRNKPGPKVDNEPRIAPNKQFHSKRHTIAASMVEQRK